MANRAYHFVRGERVRYKSIGYKSVWFFGEYVCRLDAKYSSILEADGRKRFVTTYRLRPA